MQITNRFLENRQTVALCVIAVCMAVCMLSGCAEDAGPTPEGVSDAKCAVSLHLNVASFDSSDGTATRASVNANNDENLIKNIWIFQYNADTGESIMDPKYTEISSSSDEDVDLWEEVQLTLNDNNEKSLVCIVANVGRYKGDSENITEQWAIDADDNIREEFNTYAKLIEHSIPDKATVPFVSAVIGTDGGRLIPMFGVSKAMVIASKCYVSIPLVRMFSRMEVNVDPLATQESGITVEGIEIYNIPGYCRVGSLSDGTDNKFANYPDGIEWKSYPCENTTNIILYFPENIQGKVNDMKSKTDASAESFPEKALNIKLKIKRDKDSKEQTITVYPGLDMVNDFNIRRNHIYNVNIKINNFPE